MQPFQNGPTACDLARLVAKSLTTCDRGISPWRSKGCATHFYLVRTCCNVTVGITTHILMKPIRRIHFNHTTTKTQTRTTNKQTKEGIGKPWQTMFHAQGVQDQNDTIRLKSLVICTAHLKIIPFTPTKGVLNVPCPIAKPHGVHERPSFYRDTALVGASLRDARVSTSAAKLHSNSRTLSYPRIPASALLTRT